MNLRLTYQPWGETLAELADAGRRAEEAGAETLWVSELHRSAFGTAAALAASTSVARVGTSIALAFARSPMITALEALDLDELSGGRFVLGLGSGVRRLNEDWHHVPFGKPVGHMRETVRNIRLFWQKCTTGEEMSVDGEYEPMRIRGYERPFAVARPVPVYLAAVGPSMTRLAGEIGAGWIGHELSSPSYLADRVMPNLDAGLARASRPRTDLDVVVSACCSIDRDPVVARRRAAGVVAFYATVRTYADFFEFHGLADAASDRMVDALTVTGSRDAVAERIAAYGGIADSVKLSPPTHVPPADTRTAQDEIIALIRELNR